MNKLCCNINTYYSCRVCESRICQQCFEEEVKKNAHLHFQFKHGSSAPYCLGKRIALRSGSKPFIYEEII